MTTWKKIPPKHNSYKCDAENHLWKYGLSLAIYTLIGRITYGGKNPFYGKISRLSDYFGSNPESTRRAFKRLVNDGWFKQLPVRGQYTYISHEDRAFNKDGDGCIERKNLPHWSADADPFVGKIHAACGGKIRLLPHWVGAARQHASDEEFLTELRIEFQQSSTSSPATRFWEVIRRFRAKAKTNLKVENPALK